MLQAWLVNMSERCDTFHLRTSDVAETHGPCEFKMSDQMLGLVAGRFRTLGEPYRLRILQALAHAEMTVGQLVQSLDGNQPNVSKHLQILYQAGILRRRREGNTIIYSLIDSGVLKLCDLVDGNIRRGARSAN